MDSKPLRTDAICSYYLLITYQLLNMYKSILFSLLVFLSLTALQAQQKFEVKGIDVSRWQGKIDWETIRYNKEIDFVFVKASEGRGLKDPMYCKNWRALRKARIIRGAYHFFTPNKKGKVQAGKFLRVARLKRGDLPPVIDVEKMGNDPLKTLTELKKCLDKIERRLGVTPIIYTNQNFYHEYIKDYFQGYPLWIARYHTEQPNVKDWLFWQYTNKGKVKGIEGDVDMNYFKLSYNELNRLLIR